MKKILFLGILPLLLTAFCACQKKPSKVELLRAEKHRNDSIELVHTRQTLLSADSLLQTLIPQVEPLMKLFRYEKNEKYEDSGYYIHRLLRTEGNTTIDNAELRSDAFIQDRTRPGQGLMNITLDSADPEASFTLSGNLENVLNKTPGSQLNVAMGTVDTLTVDSDRRLRSACAGLREEAAHVVALKVTIGDNALPALGNGLLSSRS